MGIEPTTNSLEGCDSTTELLPLSHKVPRLATLDLPPFSSFHGLMRTAVQGGAQRQRSQDHGGQQPHVHLTIAHRDGKAVHRGPDQNAEPGVEQHRTPEPRPAGHASSFMLPASCFQLPSNWCTGEDSNLRSSKERQIYSLLPLTARPPVRTLVNIRRQGADRTSLRVMDSRLKTNHDRNQCVLRVECFF